jgi:hypothetical protein
MKNLRMLTMCILCLVCLLLAATVLPAKGASALQEELDPSPTATATVPDPTEAPAPSPTPQPTLVPTPQPLTLTGVEPASLSAGTGGQITLLGQGFTEGMAIRLVGYGLLDSSFTSTSLARAVVPAGLNPGAYNVQVLLTDGRSEEIIDAIWLAPNTADPTPMPTQVPTPDLRQPVLVVCSAAASPARVRPGEEVRLDVEICNAGGLEAVNGMARFSSPSLVQAGEGRHWLESLLPSTSTGINQTFRAPASAAAGVYSVEVQLEANSPEGIHYSFSAQVSIEVAVPPAPSPGSSPAAPPRLAMVSSVVVPEVLFPGTSFELVLTLRNLGSQAAEQVVVAAGSSAVVLRDTDRPYLLLERLEKGAEIEVRLPLQVRRQVEAGYYPLDLNVEYVGQDGQPYSSPQQVGLDIQTNLNDRPRLVISSYNVQPAQISPGDSFELRLRLLNAGGGAARQISLTLGGESGEGLKPFSPLGTGNVRFIPVLASGEEVELAFSLLADGKTEARLYNLAVGLAYMGEQQQAYSEAQVISLQVFTRAVFRIGYYKDVLPGQVGQPLRLPVELANLSTGRFTVTSLELSCDTLKLKDKKAYVGKLEPGGIFSFDATATPQQPGTLEILATIYYLDDYNQERTFTQELILEVRAATSAVPMSETNFTVQPVQQSFWQVLLRMLRGLLGLGS